MTASSESFDNWCGGASGTCNAAAGALWRPSCRRPSRAYCRMFLCSVMRLCRPGGDLLCALACSDSLLPGALCRNPFVVGLALTYFFIYVVRHGVTSWFVFYLLQVGVMGGPVVVWYVLVVVVWWVG